MERELVADLKDRLNSREQELARAREAELSRVAALESSIGQYVASTRTQQHVGA